MKTRSLTLVGMVVLLTALSGCESIRTTHAGTPGTPAPSGKDIAVIDPARPPIAEQLPPAQQPPPTLARSWGASSNLY